jgi:hypothetical protein
MLALALDWFKPPSSLPSWSPARKGARLGACCGEFPRPDDPAAMLAIVPCCQGC